MRQLNDELKLEAVICFQAHAISFGKVNIEERGLFIIVLSKNFCEDRSENIEFDPPGALLDFQPVLCSVKKYVLT